MSKAKKWFHYYKRKYLTSYWIYVTISVMLFALSAIVVLLNLFTIRFNPAKDSTDSNLRTEFIIFVSIAIIAAAQSFVGALISLFGLRKKLEELKSKRDQMNEQLDLYNKGQDEYKSAKNKDRILIKRVQEILVK